MGACRVRPCFPERCNARRAVRRTFLSVDAGTVGGYPRVAQVLRADRHLLGQLRPGDHVRLLKREQCAAHSELRAKLDYWRAWLPEIEQVI